MGSVNVSRSCWLVQRRSQWVVNCSRCERQPQVKHDRNWWTSAPARPTAANLQQWSVAGERDRQTDGHRSVLQTLLRTLFGQCQVPITNIYVLTHSLFLHWLRMNVSWQQRMSLQYPPKVVFFICNQTPATIRYRHRLVNNDVKQPTGRWKTTNWTVVDQTRINHSMSSTAVKS